MCLAFVQRRIDSAVAPLARSLSLWGLLAIMSVADCSAWGKQPPAKAKPRPTTGIPYEGLNAEQLEALTGTKVDVLLRTGKTLKDVELVKLMPGKQPGALQEIAFKPPGGSKRTLRAMAVARLQAGDKTYDVLPDSQKKATFLLVDMARRDALVEAKLSATGLALWPRLTDAEQTRAVAEHKDFLKQVDRAFPNHPFELHETDYFLFYTDIPSGDVTPFITDLDKMYLLLGQAFGVPKGDNIWRGKAVVVAFVADDFFHRFEANVMQNPNSQNAQGIHHGSHNGNSVITCYRGDNPAFFAVVLVHETAHGYMHRFRSNADIPSWIDEGVAEWVAGNVVRASDAVHRRQVKAADQVRTTGSLGSNFLSANQIEGWQYGVASSLTDLLVKIDPGHYQALLQGIKEGQSWQESLQDACGLSPEDLVQLYGQQIGLPDLKP